MQCLIPLFFRQSCAHRCGQVNDRLFQRLFLMSLNDLGPIHGLTLYAAAFLLRVSDQLFTAPLRPLDDLPGFIFGLLQLPDTAFLQLLRAAALTEHL